MINETTACSGWTCTQCGVWVPYGQSHTCGSNNAQPLLSVPCYACGLNAKIDMLLEKLAKLIDVLEIKNIEGKKP
jgi:hypothetical protein